MDLKVIPVMLFAFIVGFVISQGMLAFLGINFVSVLLAVIVSAIVGYCIGYTGGKLLG